MRNLCLFLAVILSVSPLLAADDAPPRIRVLTYNIHHGEGADGKFDLERVAAVIKTTEPDIVALQEVDVKTKRSSGVNQSAELAKLTATNHAFGKALDFGGGSYGVAILTRWKIENAKTHSLPGSDKREPRAALSVALRINDTGPAFTFIATHLDHAADNNDRVAQCNKLSELFAADDAGPAILAGDLNAQSKDAEVKSLLEKWTAAGAGKGLLTFPSDKPAIEIDHVLLRPAKSWRVIEVKVIEEKVASDHRPLLVVVEWVAK
jgi:endonuclease/exonuclease/phosphatase family metal-dependent hydrolase